MISNILDTQPARAPRFEDFALGAVFLAVLLLGGLLWLLLAILPPVDLALIQSHCVPFQAPACIPKRESQFTYMATVAFLPTFYLVAYALFPRLSKIRFFSALARPPFPFLNAIFLYATIAYCFWFQHTEVFGYFSQTQLWVSGLLTIPVLYCFLQIPKIQGDEAYHQLIRRAPWLFFLVIAVIGVLPGLATEDNLRLRHGSLQYHLAYYVGDFFSTYSGKIPLVDFYPMYSNFLVLALKPVFLLFGYKISALTTTMTLLSVIGLTAAFMALSNVLGGKIRGLFFFLPVLAAANYSIFESTPLALNPMLYFANWPIRLFAPCLLFYFVSRFYLGRPRSYSKFLIFAFGALAALNNVDFGTAAFLASIAALTSWEALDQGRVDFKAIAKNLGIAVLAALSVLVLYFVLIFAISGTLPDLSKMGIFVDIFGTYGWSTYPIPETGLHWVFLLIYMTSIVRSLTLIFKWNLPSKSQQLRAAALMYMGVFGSISMLYFTGRSHPYVLVVFFFITAMNLSLLAFESIEALELRSRLSIVKLLPHGFSYALFASCLFYNFPNASVELAHIRGTSPLHNEMIGRIVSQLEPRLKPGQKVCLDYPYAPLIAANLGITNTFPFSDPGILILNRQIDIVIDSIVSSETTVVIGSVSDEIAARLPSIGFSLTETLPSPEAGYPSLAIWRKAP